MGIYQRIASLFPSAIIEAYKRELRYVGIQVGEKKFVGFVALFGFGIAIALTINLYLFFRINPLISFFLSFLVFAGGVYYWLSQMADKEGKQAERMLPDVLELIASNIKSGLTTERSLFASARPEFGILSEEVKEVSKQIMSGARIEDALMELTHNIKSKVLERSIWLLVQGIKSGGAIGDLLIQLSGDLREENAMKDEISANVSMYVILIFAAAVFGAPLLFGISSLIVGILVEQTNSITMTPTQVKDYSQMSQVGKFMGLPTVNITESFIVTFSAIAITITTVFAALTVGAMAAGSEKEGVKYIPFVVVAALIFFFALRITLGSALGGMSGMM